MKKIFLIILLLSLFLIPSFSFAGEYLTDEGMAEFSGLVPCGKPVKVNGSYVGHVCVEKGENLAGYGIIGLCPGNPDYIEVAKEIPCQLCHIFVMFREVVVFLLLPDEINNNLPIVLVIAILMITLGGVMFIFGGQNPDLIKRGSGILKSVGIALLIVYGAWIFVDTILLNIGVTTWTGLEGGWFKVNCPIEYSPTPWTPAP